MSSEYFEFNGWRANPGRNLLQRLEDGDQQILEPKTMDVLVELARHQGEVVSRQQFQESVWAGRFIVDEGLTRCVSELRRVLGDKPSKPIFIQTIPKRGYRLLTPVQWVSEDNRSESQAVKAPSPFSNWLSWPALIGVTLVAVVALTLVMTNYVTQNRESNRGPIAIELDHPRELYDLLENEDVRSVDAVWRHQQIPGKVVRVQTQQLSSDTETQISVKIDDGENIRLLSSLLPYDSVNEKHSAVSSIVSALELLATRNIDADVIKLSEPLRLKYQQAVHAVSEGDEEAIKQALIKFDEILAEQPNFAEAIVGKSRALRNLGSYVTFEEIKNLKGLDALLMQKLSFIEADHPFLLAKTYRPPSGEVDWENYYRVLSGLVDKAPDCFECVKRLADFYLIVGWRNKAVNLHLDHLPYYPMSSRAHTEIADLYARAGNKEGTHKHTEIVRLMGNPRYVLGAELNNYFLQGDSEKWVENFVYFSKLKGAREIRLEIPEAIAAADQAKLKTIYDQLPFSFNLALNVKDIDSVVKHVKESLKAKRYDVLSLVHGWHHSPNDLNRLYREGQSLLRSHPEIRIIFNQIGLTEFWQNSGQWPDDCAISNPPVYCNAILVKQQIEPLFKRSG